LGFAQGYGFLALLISQGVIDRPDAFGMIRDVLIVTCGSIIALWLGELITEQKVGNGISLIIFAGIISKLPSSIAGAFASYTPEMLTSYLLFGVVAILIIAGVVFLNEGERKIPIAYARRVRGNKMFGGSQSYLPLKVNQAGMIPLIFAISVLLFPQFLAQIFTIFSPGLGLKINDWATAFMANPYFYNGVYFLLVFLFTYFYTAITFNPEEVSKNLQTSGGFVPGIRPGENTKKFFEAMVNRITLWGAIFLGLIAILPSLFQKLTGVASLTVSGTAILIVVAVALETMRQVDSQLTMREYEGIE
jgi:preprotein translocase subunit SecY